MPIGFVKCSGPELTGARLTPMLNRISIGGMSTVDDLPEPLEFLQGTLEVLILRSLEIGSNHAYGIAQFLEQQSEQTLHTLLVSGAWDTGSVGGEEVDLEVLFAEPEATVVSGPGLPRPVAELTLAERQA